MNAIFRYPGIRAPFEFATVISLEVHNSDCYTSVARKREQFLACGKLANALDSFAKEREYICVAEKRVNSILSPTAINPPRQFAVHNVQQIPDTTCAMRIIFFSTINMRYGAVHCFGTDAAKKKKKKRTQRAERFFRIITRTRVTHRGFVCGRLCLVIRPGFRELQECAFAPFTDEPHGSAVKNGPCYVSLRSFAEVSAAGADRPLITTRWVYGVQITGWETRSNSNSSALHVIGANL